VFTIFPTQHFLLHQYVQVWQLIPSKTSCCFCHFPFKLNLQSWFFQNLHLRAHLHHQKLMIQDVTIIVSPIKLFSHYSCLRMALSWLEKLIMSLSFLPFIQLNNQEIYLLNKNLIFFKPEFFKATKLLVAFSPCKIVFHQLEAKHVSQWHHFDLGFI